jgi:hypothetical protein
MEMRHSNIQREEKRKMFKRVRLMGHPITHCCVVSGISTSTYYAWNKGDGWKKGQGWKKSDERLV